MEDRQVIRCPHCQLTQFMTVSGDCRKCHLALLPKPEPVAAVPEPVAAVVDAPIVARIVGDHTPDVVLLMNLLRRAYDLSQRQLAIAMNVPRTYVSKMEARKCSPGVASMVRIAAAFDLTPQAFLYIAEHIPNAQP